MNHKIRGSKIRRRQGTIRHTVWDTYPVFADPAFTGNEPYVPPNSTLNRTVPNGWATKERSVFVPAAQTFFAGLGIAAVTFGITLCTQLDKAPKNIVWWAFVPATLILTPLAGFCIFAMHNSLLSVKEEWENMDDEQEKPEHEPERTVHVISDRGKGDSKGLGDDRFDLPDSDRWRAFFRSVLYNDASFTHREAWKWRIPRHSSKKKGTWGFVEVRDKLIDLGYAHKNDDNTTTLTDYGAIKLVEIYPPTP